jgi:hypothetical protein
MKISLFPNAYEEAPVTWEGTWPEFAAILGPHQFVDGEKEDQPAFSPAEFVSGARKRLDKLVTQLWLAVLDADHLDELRATNLIDSIEDLGLAGAVYTTWRHAESPWRLRGVFPLSRPVSAAQWPLFWAKFNAMFGGICDPKCRNPARIYFVPYAPTGTEAAHFYSVFEGEPLNVEEVMALDVGNMPIVEGATELDKLSLERFKAFARMLLRRADDYKQEMGRLLVLVAKGEPFAEHGDRDNTAFKLASVLGEKFVDYDVDSIARHFAPSLALMNKTIAADPIDVSKIAEKVRRAQSKALEERAGEEQQKNKRIQEAFGNKRENPYTPGEIEKFNGIDKRWIVQRASSYYFFVDRDGGTYKGPYTTEEMVNAAVIWLAPAETAGIQLKRITKTGEEITKTPQALIQQYGTVADSVVLDLRVQRAYYDEEQRTLVEAPCPLRPITPVYHKQVAEWLELLGGDKREQLKTWLAAVTMLDRPCVALFLTGKKDTGKSLLALGVSRLWNKDKPTTLEEAFAVFNDPLARNPLCFADEQLPKDHRGFSRTAELRAHIQDTRRPFRRKFAPNAVLLGATRTIIAANNEDVLQTGENLSVHDLEAVIDRYMHVPVKDEAAEYLRSTDTFGQGWVEKDVIAEHVLWLVENHVWEPEGRFLIKTDQKLMRAMMTRRGLRSLVCQWLVGYLSDPKKFHARPNSNGYVRMKQGQLLVNVRGLINCWNVYLDSKREPCPQVGELVSALKGLYEGTERVKLQSEDKKESVNYRPINLDNLEEWSKNADFADVDLLERNLAASIEPAQA